MSAPVVGWLFFRCLRWLLWIGAAAHYTDFYMHAPFRLSKFLRAHSAHD
jgi:hypothetical protein